MAEHEEPDESEETEQAASVDFSRLYTSALKPLQDYLREQNARIARIISEGVAAQVRPVLPRVAVSQMLPMSAASETLRRQVADLTGFNDMVRQALKPLTETYWSPQWHSVFASVREIVSRLYPENLREATPSLDDLEMLLVDEGVPLMWVPRPQTVRLLLDAPDAAARRRISSRRWKGIVTDCQAVLEGIKHPAVRDARGFALEVVHALRAGHTSAAQALAANLLDSVLQHNFDKATRIRLTKNDFKTEGIKFKLEDYKFKLACTFAPVWYAHARYFPKNGDPIPRTFGRHPSAHGVSRTQYSRINATYALMLVTSVIKFFDTGLPSRP